ncbi:S8 family peptidase [Amycolatopsis suaedae]|uniref:Peptidase S8 n=1 Tax=Amycolatopsis suaedae TaxID=2510978 RepID=A0A4Q7J9L2_9PSEU|nr:S8 family serine peptidase [Amycolatopsis suaedae]RZQ63919.1 peptidase S8 [Amycolatopsis suaedae]
MPLKRIPVVVGVAGLLASGITGVGHAAEPAPSRAVTLITGDRVEIGPHGAPSVRPGPGRDGMAFSTTRHDGRLSVLPADALPLVAGGRVDPRLFDVTTLLDYGYDDAHRDTLPLIVTHPGGAAALGGVVTRALPGVGGAAVLARKDRPLWATLTAAGAERIWLDGIRRATLDRSTAQIGAPAAWQAGYTGKGVRIAVLDSGVDQTHPDLAGREVAERNFTDAPDSVDRHGHGTHVASIAAGSGPKYRGVAHEASLLDGKVLGDNGFGQESWIIAGMQWAAEQGATVVNLSLGGRDTPGTDPMEEAVNRLSREHGTLFVVAAGNTGTDGSIDSPGSADAALTVGAVDRADGLAPFSSRGPRTGDGAIKPDITAPGVGIVAALHSAGTIGKPVEPGYTALSGTSMATPHVAGAAALLAQRHPDWTGAWLKSALTGSAKPAPGLSPFAQGSGRVDLTRPVSVLAEPTSLSYGVVPWPHDDDKPIPKPLTFHNTGTTAVTLDLTAGPAVFSVREKQVTVPAGGSATVTVVADTKAGTADGVYTGAVVATGGATPVRVPLTVTRERESYDLTVSYLGEDGKATGGYQARVIGLDDDSVLKPYSPDGTIRLRLPKGRYALDNLVAGQGRLHMLPYPNLDLTRNTTITVDPRISKPVDIVPPGPATLLMSDLGYSVKMAGGRLVSTVLVVGGGKLSQASLGHLGPPSPPGTLTGIVNTQWTAADGPFYGLAWFPGDVVPAGFSRTVTMADLATVRASFGAPVPDRTGRRAAIPHLPDGTFLTPGMSREVPLPGAVTEYVTTDGVSWSGLLQQRSSTELETELFGPRRVYRAGQEYSERFNDGMFGPAFPPQGPNPWVDRRGDSLEVFLPLLGDAAGNGGLPRVGEGNTKLYRGTELVGESAELGYGFFRLPAQESQYRLTTTLTRPPALGLSTQVSAEWTFRSGHVPGEPRAVPLCAIRFAPELDDANSAPAGRPLRIPISLGCGDGGAARPDTLTVDVSYDEGRSWQPARVRDNSVAYVHHPAAATSVSLRAAATSEHGSVAHTIVRAYKLR